VGPELRGIVALLLALAAGCEGGPGQVVVQVRSDLIPIREVAAIEARVERDGVELGAARIEVEADTPLAEGLRVIELPSVATGRVRAVVSAVDAAGATVVERPMSLDVTSGAVALGTALLTRDCRDVECPNDDPAATACLAGRCVEERCVEEATEGCGDVECATAADCGAVAACGAYECTPSGACLAVASAGACGATEVCHPDLGCVPADPCAGLECGLVSPQCGCGPDEGCYWDGGRPLCEVAGGLGVGAPCEAPADCRAGLGCADIAGMRRCAPYCQGDSECAPPARCVATGGQGHCVGVDCSFAPDAGCAGGETCIIRAEPLAVGGGTAAVRWCRTAGPDGDFRPCSGPLTCQRGLCAQFLGTNTCNPHCDSDDDCPGRCIGINQLLDIGVEAGGCAPACDPFDGSGCADGMRCRFQLSFGITGEIIGITECGFSENRPAGSGCTPNRGQCADGVTCHPTRRVCETLCDLDAPPPGCSCVPYETPVDANGVRVGTCR